MPDGTLLRDGGPAGAEETHCTRGPEEVGGRLVPPVGNPVNPREHEVAVHRVCETGLMLSWAWAGVLLWGRRVELGTGDADMAQLCGLPTSQGPATPRVDVHPQPGAGWVCRRRAVGIQGFCFLKVAKYTLTVTPSLQQKFESQTTNPLNPAPGVTEFCCVFSGLSHELLVTRYTPTLPPFSPPKFVYL